jgi:DNA repair exonuclease SbcCD ATPase subunit
MDFIEALRGDYDARVKPRVQERDALAEQIRMMRAKIETETAAAEKTFLDIGRLKNQIGAALAAGADAYKKLETALEAATSEHERILNRIKALEERLPHTQTAWEEAARKVHEQRDILARERLPLAQDEFEERIEDAVRGSYDAWIVAWGRLAREDGDSGFRPTVESLPALKGDRINPSLIGGIVTLSAEQYEQAINESPKREARR